MISQFYLTAEYPCSYFPDKQARSLVMHDDQSKIECTTFSRLIEAGFRRSGNYIYRANCDACNECKASRIPVRDFVPNRTQRKINKKNDGLTLSVSEVRYSDEKLGLYKKYLNTRHPGNKKSNKEIEQEFNACIINSKVDSKFIEFRNETELKACCLIDHIENGISAVYTFYDFSTNNSLGTYCILSLIKYCIENGFEYLYLGYLIRNCQKMSYKANFNGHQILIDGKWSTHLK